MPGFLGNPASICTIFSCISRPQNVWNETRLCALFTSDVVRQIQAIPIGPSNLKDRWIWHFNTKGKFSVKSCYHLLKNYSNDPPLSSKEWKWLWGLNLPQNIKFFIWRVGNNALANLTNLASRNCASNVSCPRCNREPESILHLFFTCEFNNGLWSHFATNLSLPHAADSIQHWILDLNKVDQHLALRAIACFWTTWKSRNDVVFKGSRTSLISLKHKCSSYIADFLSLVDTHPPIGTTQQIHSSSNQPPSNDHRTLLCDGSFLGTTQKAGFCAVLLSTNGNVIDGKAGSFFCRTSICAEATALLNAVNLALLYPYPTVIFSDCRVVVEALRSPHHQWPWECEATLAYISDTLLTAHWIEIQHCRRQFVHKVDRVAKLSRDNLLPPNWMVALM
ncbi:Putative ribonuclease H protein At1g65750 [Linum perenne]